MFHEILLIGASSNNSQVNYCRIVEGQLEHWPLTQNVMSDVVFACYTVVQKGPMLDC